MTHNDAKILLESYSPNCPLSVIVEETESSTYMYLRRMENGEFPSVISAAWVRNHKESVGSNVDITDMQEGHPPMLPGEFCNHPQGKDYLKPQDLECVWFEDGNGAALIENNEILCIIPSWTGSKFPPYSKDCIKENSLAVPITEGNILINTVRRAQEFWSSWNDDSWREFRDSRVDLLNSHFGQYRNYYAIDGDKWPVKSLVRFEVGDITYLVTIGVSLIPQPTIELFTNAPENLRRIELGLAIKTNELEKNETQILKFLSMTTNMPWENISWLGHGHTLECGSVFSKEGNFPYSVLINSREEGSLPQIKFPDFRGDPVNLLWLTPISKTEFDSITNTGVSEFLKQIRGKDRSLIFNSIDNKGAFNKMKSTMQLLFKK